MILNKHIEKNETFDLQIPFEPAGDQPEAIKQIMNNLLKLKVETVQLQLKART